MDDSDKRRIASLVRTGRAAKRYTQQGLADQTGVTLRSIQRIEKGEVMPREYTLRLLEEQLGIAIRLNVAAIPNTVQLETTDASFAKEPTINGASKLANPEEGPISDKTSSPGGEQQAAPGQQRGLSKGRQWILTVSLGLLLPLLTIAYLAQSARWPETDFERLLIWSGVVAIYSGILWKIWK